MTKKTKAIIILFGFSMPSLSSIFGGGGSSSAASSAAGSSGGGGDAFGALTDWYGAKEQNRANTRLAKNQMEFQESMSNTAYQRASNDLNKAGINRILAGKFGAASTPAGAMASMENLGAAALRGAHSAASIQKTGTENQLAEIKAIIEDTKIPAAEKNKIIDKKVKSYIEHIDEKIDTMGKGAKEQVSKFYQMINFVFFKGGIAGKRAIARAKAYAKSNKTKQVIDLAIKTPLGYQK